MRNHINDSSTPREPRGNEPAAQVFDDSVGYLRFDRAAHSWRPGTEARVVAPTRERWAADNELRCA